MERTFVYQERINALEVILDKGRNISGAFNLNYLAKSNNIYIMDNHLAAIWCWLHELNMMKPYNLLHIDRHYDCLTSNITAWMDVIKDKQIDIADITISEFTDVKYSNKLSNELLPIFSYDNYIPLFFKLYPSKIMDKIFITQKNGRIEDNGIKESLFEPAIYDVPENLSYWISHDNDNKWIVNIDVDFFFTDYNGMKFQFLSDDYVRAMNSQLKKCIDKIEVLTIALSPEFCGGWDNADRIVNIITDGLIN